MDSLEERNAFPLTNSAARDERSFECDVCGRAVTVAAHPAAEKGLAWMCRSCGLEVSSLPGTLHRAASRFLMGNVL